MQLGILGSVHGQEHLRLRWLTSGSSHGAV